jgi:hypothetical protein
MNIEDVSNPDVVLKRAKRLYGNDVQIYISTQRQKHMIINPITGKKIDFGSSLYQDYTKHGDENGDKCLEKETINGKSLIGIHQHTNPTLYLGEGFNLNGFN